MHISKKFQDDIDAAGNRPNFENNGTKIFLLKAWPLYQPDWHHLGIY